MNKPYNVFSQEEAAERYPDLDIIPDENRYHYCIIFDDGKTVRLVGDDQCEPEDALLIRDLSWVQHELNRVYNMKNKTVQDVDQECDSEETCRFCRATRNSWTPFIKYRTCMECHERYGKHEI